MTSVRVKDEQLLRVRVDGLVEGDLIFLLAKQTHLFYPGIVIFCLVVGGRTEPDGTTSGGFEAGRAVGVLDGLQRFDSYLLDSEDECFVLAR